MTRARMDERMELFSDYSFISYDLAPSVKGATLLISRGEITTINSAYYSIDASHIGRHLTRRDSIAGKFSHIIHHFFFLKSKPLRSARTPAILPSAMPVLIVSQS